MGFTEVIMDNLNPQWVKQFDVQYNFEVRETYKVVIYDVDDFDNIQNFEGHDTIGYLEFTLHEVVTSIDQTLVMPLQNYNRPAGKSGIIKITGEETKRIDVTELNMLPQAIFGGQSGLNYFMIMKQIG